MRAKSVQFMVIISSLLALTAFVFPGSASAHKPIYDSGGSTLDSAMMIPDASVSYAIFAQFDPFQPQIQYYEFPVEQGQLFNFQLGIPALDWLEGFAPVVLLFGPGLNPPDSETSSLLQEFGIELSGGNGAMSWEYTGSVNKEEFEPFTQVVFWERQDAELTLPESGTYYLAVAVSSGSDSSDAGGKGKYMLAPGKAEEFGLLDYVLIPVDWMLSQLFWEQNLAIILIPTAITVILGMSFVFIRARQGRFLADVGPRIKLASCVGLVGSLLMVGSGLNQTAFLLGSGHFPESSLNLVVLAIQIGAVILGLVALWLTLGISKSASWKSVISAAIVAVLGLILGAGWIIGPVLFVAACISITALARAET